MLLELFGSQSVCLFKASHKHRPPKPFATMAAHVLVLYVAVNKEDVHFCETSGSLPRRYAGGRHYIGLRERPEDALERASIMQMEPVSKITHALLEWRLSAAALAHFVTTCSEKPICLSALHFL